MHRVQMMIMREKYITCYGKGYYAQMCPNKKNCANIRGLVTEHDHHIFHQTVLQKVKNKEIMQTTTIRKTIKGSKNEKLKEIL